MGGGLFSQAFSREAFLQGGLFGVIPVSVPNFSFLACLEVARLVRLARLARLVRLVRLGYLG